MAAGLPTKRLVMFVGNIPGVLRQIRICGSAASVTTVWMLSLP
ncbi:MAG: hypothetical protein ABSA79_11435 [Candidatus Bathyarchaeia archaeon]